MKRVLLAVVIAALVIAAVTLYNPETPEAQKEGIKAFGSSEEFREYIAKYSGGTYPSYYQIYAPVMGNVKALTDRSYEEVAETGVVVERFSQTNVQVAGIDEPDTVKTDGKHIFFSKITGYYYIPEIIPVKGETVSINAFPPQNMSVGWKINTAGNLLLYNDVLAVLGGNEIHAYRISDKSEIWKVELNGSLVDARLYNGKIYLVTRNAINPVEPCPVKPLSINGKVYEVVCKKIYHPVMPAGMGMGVDATYSIISVDIESGKVVDSASFVGSAGHTVVYMSKNNIYVTYNAYADPAKLMYDFVKANTDIIPDWVVERIEKLMKYDISNRAKSVEISVIIEQLMSSLGKDERMKFENEYWNRWQDFLEEHARDLEKTYIAKFALNLHPEGIGKVPGRLLNQFSLDEYRGYLRLATTVGGKENDLYVLDDELSIVGSVQGFGLDERIYAVRFVGDKGYIVTFRQTDPFFVLDLSDPQNPGIAGELKIPGFSSYLHPISEDLILGIGKEDRYVKISLFDVSSQKPVEIDRYTLKEYWSDILNTHHAFLLDRKHEIFFLPAAKGGYVFSYSDGIRLIKAVGIDAKRAVYINDYLYIIAADRVVAYDENTWEQAGEVRI